MNLELELEQESPELVEITESLEVTEPVEVTAAESDIVPVAAPVVIEGKRWYPLRVISGKEKKIKERIDLEIERSNWHGFVFKVVIPTEKVYKVRNGKKVITERNLMPGYIMIEALTHKLKGEIAKAITDIPNVINFIIDKETPVPMTNVEANRLFGIVDDNAETGESIAEPFLVGEAVTIIDGPFASFIGDIQKLDEEKKKITVIVKIFGRGTEVELSFLQVEKIS